MLEGFKTKLGGTKMITTTKFDAEVRIDMMVPTRDLGTFKKGSDVTETLKTTFLNGYIPEEVAAVAIGGGTGVGPKVAFLWQDAADAEMWYIGQKAKQGWNPDRAADKFYEVAKMMD